jgi:hypothetical protein
MATTNVKIKRNEGAQFRGVYYNVWVVTATIDYPSIGSNQTGYETVAVPGLDPEKDHILSFNRHAEVEAHGYFEVAHTHTDAIHVGWHNTSGGSYDPVAAEYSFVVARLVDA